MGTATVTNDFWRVPATTLDDVLERIEHLVSSMEKSIDKEELYRTLLHIVDKQLAESRSAISNRNLPKSYTHQTEVSMLFDEVLAIIRTHTISPLRQQHILGNLLSRVAAEIALLHPL